MNTAVLHINDRVIIIKEAVTTLPNNLYIALFKHTRSVAKQQRLYFDSIAQVFEMQQTLVN